MGSYQVLYGNPMREAMAAKNLPEMKALAAEAKIRALTQPQLKLPLAELLAAIDKLEKKK